jgi:branched-chain amino acid transport system permease protein
MKHTSLLRSRLSRDGVIGGLLLLIALLFPLTSPERYFIGQATLLFIWSAVVTQWNLVFGVAGIFSVGHTALLAAGAYTAALLGLYLGWSMWIGSVLGGLTALIISLAMGAAALRLRGPYVAVLTLAFVVVMYQLISSDIDCYRMVGVTCNSFTGGSRGLSQYGNFGFDNWLPYAQRPLGNYFLGLLLLLLSTVVAVLVLYSPIGLAFRALRDNETCAACRGMNHTKYQLLVFAISAVITGISGGVYAGVIRSMGPSLLGLSTLVYLLGMMVVGGKGLLWGPIFGTAFIMATDQITQTYGEWRNFGVAVVIVLCLLFFPRGLAGGAESLIAAGVHRLKKARQ